MAPEQAEGGASPARSTCTRSRSCSTRRSAGRTRSAPRARGRPRGASGCACRRWPPPAATCRATCATAIDVGARPDPEERGALADLRDALLDAEDDVADEPGHVTADAPTLAGLAERTRRWRTERRDARDDAAWQEDAARSEAAHHGPAEHAGAVALDGPRGRRLGAPGRAFAGVSAGALAYWAVTTLPADLTLGGAVAAPEPLAVAGIAGAVVALLPRLGWLLALVALLVVIGPEAASLGVLAAAVPAAALLVFHGVLWSLPAAAGALQAIGIAGAYPAIAGQASSLAARAALGALGFWWLTAGALVTDPQPKLSGLIEPGVLGLAGLWALAAAVLPLVVRGRSGVVDALGAAAWAAALAAATPAVADALQAAEPANTGPAAAIGAGVAVAARALTAGARE
jgi:hypothetical protein